MNFKLYMDKVKCRASVKELVEFAFTDEDICRGEGNRKLTCCYDRGVYTKRLMSDAYKHMLSDEGKWKKGTVYEYQIMSFDWDEIDPESVFEIWGSIYSELFKSHVVLVSVHADEDSIYFHAFIRKVEDAIWPYDKLIEDHISIVTKPDYFDAMTYLMY